ncbi:MAG: cytochrome c3 family protein [Deltaproteobacteria bacterium]|nr:cytochrome c3 family protein [Deltaproteobacteria bacterium]MCL5276267.1 cytochrome c3 family protein [Deltaproteobacteria bacterium]
MIKQLSLIVGIIILVPAVSLADTSEGCTTSKCHTGILSGSFKHPALDSMGCKDCHVPAKGNHKFTLSARVPALCYTCHDKKNTKKDVHPPVAQGRCVMCHNPHSENNNYLLRTKGMIMGPVFIQRQDNRDIYLVQPINNMAGLCLSCHKDMIKKTYVHAAVKLGKCLTCHHAHESEHDHLLRKPSPVSNTCFICHADDLTGRRVIHPAVAGGECTNCHSPHASDNPYMLAARGKELCYMCHEPKDKDKVVHPAIEKYGCTACHDPHGTNNDFMLKKPVNELCATCHKKQADGYHVFTTPQNKPHPVSGVYDMKELKGKPLTCISCHNPHSSNHPYMWYAGETKLDMCKRCHGKESNW